MEEPIQHQLPKKKILPRRKEDFLTIFEKSWRDWLLSPITYPLNWLGITPNMITAFGGILIIVSAIGYFLKAISMQANFWIIVVALISDALDGSTARNHNKITALGVWLDRIRDGMWVSWVSYLLYTQNIIRLETIGILFSFDFILAIVVLRSMIIKFLKTTGHFMELAKQFIKSYTLENLQPNIFGRANFACWGFSYTAYLIFLATRIAQWQSAGDIFLTFAIVFGALRLYRAYTESWNNHHT